VYEIVNGNRVAKKSSLAVTPPSMVLSRQVTVSTVIILIKSFYWSVKELQH